MRQNPSKRGRTYQVIGALLVVLGVLFNLVGTSFGAAPANTGFGLITMIVGVCYWGKGRLLSLG